MDSSGAAHGRSMLFGFVLGCVAVLLVFLAANVFAIDMEAFKAQLQQDLRDGRAQFEKLYHQPALSGREPALSTTGDGAGTGRAAGGPPIQLDFLVRAIRI